MFDMLSDVGGLSEMAAVIITILLAIWNYLAFENYMVSLLFKYKKQGDGA